MVISISHPLEAWFGETYCSKEIIYGERSAFFLPKASPLTVRFLIVTDKSDHQEGDGAILVKNDQLHLIHVCLNLQTAKYVNACALTPLWWPDFSVHYLCYRVLKINASREMERNWPTAALLAATDPAWLMFSFPPSSRRRIVCWPGISRFSSTSTSAVYIHYD